MESALAIGKIIYGKIPSKDDTENWNFPHFHFVSYAQDGGIYTHCIELATHSWGIAIRESIESMLLVNNTIFDKFINQKKSINKFFDYLINEASGNKNDDLWESYRIAEISLARSGADIGSAMINQLRNQILNELLGKINNIKDIEVQEVKEVA